MLSKSWVLMLCVLALLGGLSLTACGGGDDDDDGRTATTDDDDDDDTLPPPSGDDDDDDDDDTGDDDTGDDDTGGSTTTTTSGSTTTTTSGGSTTTTTSGGTTTTTGGSTTTTTSGGTTTTTGGSTTTTTSGSTTTTTSGGTTTTTGGSTTTTTGGSTTTTTSGSTTTTTSGSTTTTTVTTTTTTTTTTIFGNVQTPTGVKVLDFDDDWVAIGWNPETGGDETGFKIYAQAEASKAFSLIGTVDSQVPYFIHDTAACGTKYTYQVTALAGEVETDPATTDEIATNRCDQSNWVSETVVQSWGWDGLIERFLTEDSDDPILYLPATKVIRLDAPVSAESPTILSESLTRGPLSMAPTTGGDAWVAYRLEDYAHNDSGVYVINSKTLAVDKISDHPMDGTLGISTLFDAGQGDTSPHVFAASDVGRGDETFHFYKDGGNWKSESVVPGTRPHAVYYDGDLAVLARLSNGKGILAIGEIGLWDVITDQAPYGPAAVDGDGDLVVVEAHPGGAIMGRYDGGDTFDTKVATGLTGEVTVAIDNDGDAVLAGLNESGGNWQLVTAKENGGGFDYSILATGSVGVSDGDESSVLDMVFNSSNEPIVAFAAQNALDGTMQAIYVYDAAGVPTATTTKYIEETLPGLFVSIRAHGSDLHVAYQDYAGRGIFYTKFSPLTADFSEPELVAADATLVPRVVVDDSGVPYVAYVDADGEHVILRKRTAANTWTTQTPYTASGIIQPYLGVTFDSDSDEFYMAFAEVPPGKFFSTAFNSDIHVINGADGGSFSDDTAASSVPDAIKVDIELDNPDIHLVYNNASSMVYAYSLNGGSWQTADPLINLGDNSFDMGVDDGQVVSAAVDDTTFSFLVYNNPSWVQVPLGDKPTLLQGTDFETVSVSQAPSFATACVGQDLVLEVAPGSFIAHHFSDLYEDFLAKTGFAVACQTDQDDDTRVHVVVPDPRHARLMHFSKEFGG
ncbi:MAG: fibronectin type III domain-containing protein [Deltaproteobacteria bacterium]|nr:fibronectin type III domain-containing protein [Deltaproteobacteria bacterium]